MKIIKQSAEFVNSTDLYHAATKLEAIGRVCYKSEDKITSESAISFLNRILNSGHHSVIEHLSASVRMITNRGVTHEIIRHRLASYSQESTRYCDYSKDKFGGDLTFIQPVWIDDVLLARLWDMTEQIDGNIQHEHASWKWFETCKYVEKSYQELRELGWSPQYAREILPNSLKTEIIMTANLREWLHFFKLRTAKAAHPQMRDLAIQVQDLFIAVCPEIFQREE